jgi:hypothetical protein
VRAPEPVLRVRVEGQPVSARPVHADQLWPLAVGFCVWCSALVIIYVVHSVGCAFAWPNGAIRLGLSLTILIHLALIEWLRRNYAKTSPDPALDPTGCFVHWVIAWTLIAAFITIVFTLGPTLLLTTCI